MGMAQTIDMHEDQKDDICRQYDEILSGLEELEVRSDFWRQTLDHPVMRDKLKDLENELAGIRETWDDIKPADFKDSQSRVRAIRYLMNEFRHEAEDAEAALKAKKQLKASYEIGNELILRGAGYSFDAAAAKAAAAEAEPAVEGESDTEEITPPDGMIMVRLSDSPSKKLNKSLIDAGFYRSDENDEIRYYADDTMENRQRIQELYEEHEAISEVLYNADSASEGGE